MTLPAERRYRAEMLRYTASLVLFSSILSAPALASGMKLLDVTCKARQHSTEYRILYTSSAAPGGPVSYTLEISLEGKSVHLPVTRRPQLSGDALLVMATQLGDESEVSGHAVFYSRNRATFLDVALSGESASLNTSSPLELVCEPSPSRK